MTSDRLAALNEAIAEVEKRLTVATEEWTHAKSIRDPALSKLKEEELIALTNELNILKMRRPV